jgi:hypothetical protein
MKELRWSMFNTYLHRVQHAVRQVQYGAELGSTLTVGAELCSALHCLGAEHRSALMLILLQRVQRAFPVS